MHSHFRNDAAACRGYMISNIKKKKTRNEGETYIREIYFTLSLYK